LTGLPMGRKASTSTMKLLDKSKVDMLVVHCSDSEYGDRRLIDEWHRNRDEPFDMIGYHFAIGNAYPSQANFRDHRPMPKNDGLQETGRDLKYQGAHVKGYNHRSVGICLIGRDTFTSAQLEQLKSLVNNLQYNGYDGRVVGHYELDDRKPCPCIDMNWLRSFLET